MYKNNSGLIAKTKASEYKKGLCLTEKLVRENPLLFLYETVVGHLKEPQQMNFQLKKNFRKWLSQLNGKTIDKVFQVDFNKERHEDLYLPWLFFITFADIDKFLEIEGDFDGSHIRIKFCDKSKLDKKIGQYNLPDVPDLWRVYDTTQDETLGRLIGQKIDFIEYGIDKDVFEINGTKITGQKDVFDFITFHGSGLKLTIFESSGLGVSDDPNVKLMFEDTFDRYKTK